MKKALKLFLIAAASFAVAGVGMDFLLKSTPVGGFIPEKFRETAKNSLSFGGTMAVMTLLRKK
jgi:hypothetical protein